MFRASILVAALAATVPAHAAEIRRLADAGVMADIRIEGEIVAGDSSRLRLALVGIKNRGLILELNSPGGLVAEGDTIGAGILNMRKAGVNVVAAVGAGDMCASSCVTIFTAASARYVQAGGTAANGAHVASAIVSVHTAAEEDGAESMRTMAETVAYTRDMKALGMPDSVIGKLITTGDRMATALTSADLQAWPGTHIVAYDLK